MDSIIKKDFQYELEQIDWDFVGERGTDSYVSFHWYPARFVPQIPSILIGYFSERGDRVLDPFCGSGTTLLEAFRLDRRPIGIDVHPAAIMMTKAKFVPIEQTHIAELRDEILDKATLKLSKHMSASKSRALSDSHNDLHIPNKDENRKWFHPQTLMELACIYSAIGELENIEHRIIAQSCFSSILNRVCSQNRHYGWICDNVHPKTLMYKDAFNAFRSKFQEYQRFKEKYEVGLQTIRSRYVHREDIELLTGDSRQLLNKIQSNSIDLVITSPPYLNVTDYIKSFRLYMLWFGLPDWENLCAAEIGARCRRSQKDCYQNYLNDMRTCIEQIAKVLKKGKFLCLVIGESSSYPSYSQNLLEMCRSEGLKEILRLTRNIAKQRLLYPRLSVETIIIMRRR